MLTFHDKPYLHFLIYLMTLGAFLGKSFKVFAGLVVIFFLYEKLKEKDFSFFNNKIFIVLSFWSLYLASSSLWAVEPLNAILGSLEFFLWVITLLAVSNILTTKADIDKFIKVQAFIILFVCLNIFFQYIFGFNFFGTPLREGIYTTDMTSIKKVYPYVLTLWISLFGTILVTKGYDKKDYLLYFFTLFVLLLSIPLSGARGPIIILAVFLPLIAWLSPYRKIAFSSLLGFVIIALVFVFTNPHLQERLSTLKNPFEDQRQIRVSIWLTGLEMFKENKLLGVGFNNFENNVFTYYDKSFDSIIIVPEKGKSTPHAHSPWIDILSEQGLIGLGFLLTLLFFIAKIIYQNRSTVFIGSIGIWYSFSLLNSNFVLSSGISSFFMILSITFFLVINNYVKDRKI